MTLAGHHRLGAMAVAAAVALGGCGHGRPAMSAQAANDLQTKAREVRAAVVAQDRAAAEGKLAALRDAVATWEAQGQLSQRKGNEVLDAAVAVEHQLSTMPTPPPPTEPPTTEADNQGDKKKKGKGRGGHD